MGIGINNETLHSWLLQLSRVLESVLVKVIGNIRCPLLVLYVISAAGYIHNTTLERGNTIFHASKYFSRWLSWDLYSRMKLLEFL